MKDSINCINVYFSKFISPSEGGAEININGTPGNLYVFDYEQQGTWRIQTGKKDYSFGINHGDIMVANSKMYVAQHADVQKHKFYGFQIRVKYCPLDEYVHEGSPLAISEDGKRIYNPEEE